MAFDRGGLKNLSTKLTILCDSEKSSGEILERKAVMVDVPDTVHIYTADSVIYDYIRTCTPQIKQQHTPQYTEDQIFMDVAYALIIDNKYVIPIVLPQEILTHNKIAKSIEWSFTKKSWTNCYFSY